MQIYRDLFESSKPSYIAIGSFDGVHRGHQELLNSLVAETKRSHATSMVITFEPHPRQIVSPEYLFEALMTTDEKIDRIAKLGVDELIVLEFTKEISHWSAERFCQQLVEKCKLSKLFIGPGFAFGHKREGNASVLTNLGQKYGFEVIEVKPVAHDNGIVTSSRIREVLNRGEIGLATELLGHEYFIDAEVVYGNQMGRQIGYPTANLAAIDHKCLPKVGIYAGWVRVANDWHMAATSVGYRPTFDDGKGLVIESFLLDFEEDLYGQKIRTAFVGRLRDEEKFSTVDELVEQIKKDVDKTRLLLAARIPPIHLI